MIIVKCKVITISLIIFLFSILYSGCIEQNGNKNQNSFQENIMNLNISTIALTSLDVEINQTSSKHITEPYDFNNAAGAGKTWYVLEQYQSMFTTGSMNTSQHQKKSVIQVITKLESIEKAQEYMSLKIVNLIEDNGYSELIAETIGNSSFYLKKNLSQDDDEYMHYLCYFSFYNIIIVVGGVAMNSLDIYEYAQIIEQKINDFLYC